MCDACSVAGRAHVFVEVHTWIGVRAVSFVVEDNYRLVDTLGIAKVVIEYPGELNIRTDVKMLGGKVKEVAGFLNVSLLMGADEGCELHMVPMLSSSSEIHCQLYVRLPDMNADYVVVDVNRMPRGGDNANFHVPRMPFRIQNLCGSQRLRGYMNIDILNPVLIQRRGTLSGSLMEIITPGGTFTFRRNRGCVDFKGARKISCLRPDLRVATCGVYDDTCPPHVYMAVMRGALGSVVDFQDPFKCYLENMSKSWCYARHGFDKLNGHPTLDLVDIKWDVLLSEYKGVADYDMYSYLCESKSTRFKISRRGWVLMYTIFKKGGIPWDEEMEDQFIGLSNFALCRIAAITTEMEQPSA